MMNLHIVEKFNTSMGTVVVVEDNVFLKIGETFLGSDGIKYTVKKIQMPTKPNGNIGFIVQ